VKKKKKKKLFFSAMFRPLLADENDAGAIGGDTSSPARSPNVPIGPKFIMSFLHLFSASWKNGGKVQVLFLIVSILGLAAGYLQASYLVMVHASKMFGALVDANFEMFRTEVIWAAGMMLLAALLNALSMRMSLILIMGRRERRTPRLPYSQSRFHFL
jgi:hypothetical protein